MAFESFMTRTLPVGPDYSLNIWPFTTMKNYPIAPKKIAKLGSKY